jgi:RNA polymerase sigma-B factor
MATARAKRGTAPPTEASSHSGRLLLRMPPSLHADLAQAADNDNQSLNAYITRVLSEEMNGGRKPDPAARVAGRLVRAAVIADLVLVAVAAALAIALLVIAWP